MTGLARRALDEEDPFSVRTRMGKAAPEVNEDLEAEPPRRISRRTVAKGMQWAVPVIAVSAPAPAYAASGDEILTGNGAACKLPGNSQSLYKGYALGFSAHNPFGVPLIVSILEMTLNGIPLGDLRIINLDGCLDLGTTSFTIPANTDYPNLVVLTQGAGDSQAGTLTATYTISGGPGGAVTASTEVGTVPPLQGGACTGFTQAEKDCIAQQNRVE